MYFVKEKRILSKKDSQKEEIKMENNEDSNYNCLYDTIGIVLAIILGCGLILILPMIIVTILAIDNIGVLFIWLVWILLLCAMCLYYEQRKLSKEERPSILYVARQLITSGHFPK